MNNLGPPAQTDKMKPLLDLKHVEEDCFSDSEKYLFLWISYQHEMCKLINKNMDILFILDQTKPLRIPL